MIPDEQRQLVFVPHPDADYDYDYGKIVAEINELLDSEPRRFIHFARYWCQESLFFLLYFVLRVPVNHPWLVERIKEVQDKNDRTLDLWAREHYKSSIITYGLNIQEILRDPDTRIGIFSHTRAIAKAFLRRIKITFESNDFLKALFPDILFQNPSSQAPKWSEDDGIIVNRPTVYQECTVEAWGLIDGMPTSKHFTVLNYDDIVTKESVSTSEQLQKVDDCFRLSLNLGTDGGKKRVIGTIYHYNDQHIKLMNQGGWILRKYPAADKDDNSVLLSQETLDEKRRDYGPYVYACQMMLSPVSKKDQKFKPKWLQFYKKLPKDLSLFLLCDPANAKKYKSTQSDYTVYWLWGVDVAGQKFLIDMVRDRLELTERWTVLRDMVLRHRRIQLIGYEQYGMTADIQHFNEMMAQEGVYFSIVELKGRLAKKDRIDRLIPQFEQGRVWLPHYLPYQTKEGEIVDLVKAFVEEEYLAYPFCRHDDMLDAASRIEDENIGIFAPYDDVDEFGEDLYEYGRKPDPVGRCPATGY